MNTFRLKVTDGDFEELKALVFADLPKEAAAFALAGIAKQTSGADIIIRRPLAIPRENFSAQYEYHLEISPRAINGLAALCQSNSLGAVLCHSHPGNIPYSSSDDYGEQRIVETLRHFLPTDAPIASLLFFPGGMAGRVWLPSMDEPVSLSEIIVLGRHIKRLKLDSDGFQDTTSQDAIFDRQVCAFGKHGNALIAQAKVGIVGVGGTGSAIAEQLLRLGVMDFILIDPDQFEPSNITRMYGTFYSHFNKLRWHPRRNRSWKVDLVAAHLSKINPKARVRTIPRSVVLKEAAQSLLDRAVIFLCTDEQWGRSIVNQIAYQYFIPTINLGVRIAAKDGVISAAVGNVDVLRPDVSCLWCKHVLRSERIAAESTPRQARQKLASEGYVEGIDSPEPAVISLTTTMSGVAVTQFLQLHTDFMGAAGEISRLNYNVIEGTMSRGTASIPRECICRKVRGFGDMKPLLTLTDQTLRETKQNN